MELIFNIDANILLWIQEYLRVSWLNPIVIFITSLGNGGAIWIVTSLALLIPKKTRGVGVMCMVSLIVSALFNNALLKNIVCRTRPFYQIETLVTLIKYPSDYSFPSGHSAASFACAWVMWKKLPKSIGLPALILAAGIAASRLYLGVHYPTDVLVGSMSGILISCFVVFVFETRNKIQECKDC